MVRLAIYAFAVAFGVTAIMTGYLAAVQTTPAQAQACCWVPKKSSKGWPRGRERIVGMTTGDRIFTPAEVTAKARWNYYLAKSKDRHPDSPQPPKWEDLDNEWRSEMIEEDRAALRALAEMPPTTKMRDATHIGDDDGCDPVYVDDKARAYIFAAAAEGESQ